MTIILVEKKLFFVVVLHGFYFFNDLKHVLYVQQMCRKSQCFQCFVIIFNLKKPLFKFFRK